MGLANPPQTSAKPFADVYSEGDTFILDDIRTVKARTDYGEGEMVLLRVRNQTDELSIWGTYLIHQAHAAEKSDFGQRYRIVSKVVEGFSKRPVKALEPVTQETLEEEGPGF